MRFFPNPCVVLMFLLVMISGCSEKTASNIPGGADVSDDIVYQGILPCADCEGIETTVTLHKGNRYTLRSVYLGADQPPMVETGTFKRHRQESRIVLDDGRQFKQGENSLLHLTLDGEVITSALAEYYVLRQVQ